SASSVARAPTTNRPSDSTSTSTSTTPGSASFHAPIAARPRAVSPVSAIVTSALPVNTHGRNDALFSPRPAAASSGDTTIASAKYRAPGLNAGATSATAARNRRANDP